KKINLEKLPKHFDFQNQEKKWNDYWEEQQVYYYQQNTNKEKFIIDTPPPTVSGSLHIGHVFSYTQTDIIARYQRMCGKNVFYPMGWDDNGLPTERRVQNYYHVQCDPETPFAKGATYTPATAKKRKKPLSKISRRNFIELCHQLTTQDEEVFKDLWQRIGLSVDWNLEYATIDEKSQIAAQYSFLDLLAKDQVYTCLAPAMWDTDFATAIAQAEIEDREENSYYYFIRFSIEESKDKIIIATTRPELIPACIALTVHPDDQRYRHVIGKTALTPLFQAPVPIMASLDTDPEKGTGIMMICTFGDSADVEWWQNHDLPLKQIISQDGRLLSLKFGSPDWESRNVDQANHYYNQLIGRNIRQAREIIIDLLKNNSMGNYFTQEPQQILHAVRYYEKGKKAIEYIPARQWFVKLLDKKDQLLNTGKKINWHPEQMKHRFLNWTENLKLDWCISRQRFFGVPIPIWYPLDERGNILYNQPLLPELKDLPIDPASDCPAGYLEEQRNQPSGFIGEKDVFDTWFTSSLTPQIAANWIADKEKFNQHFPMSIRPQSHEIIRTWAFYTIAKSLLHHRQLPWNHVLISGWIMDPDRKKMSKSSGNVVTPIAYLERYGADSVRYWSGKARLGIDTTFDEKIMKIGQRLVTKLYNAAKLITSLDNQDRIITTPLDLSFIHSLKKLVKTATSLMNQFEYAQALAEIERFFWENFTDSLLELLKSRSKGEGSYQFAEYQSAKGVLKTGLSVLLRLFAPFLPFITEEIWSWEYSDLTHRSSIHQANWPTIDEFDQYQNLNNDVLFNAVKGCLKVIHKYKSENHLAIGQPLDHLTICAGHEFLELIKSCQEDLKNAARVGAFYWKEINSLGENTIEITNSKHHLKKHF
ncbi:MAG: valine--tRNA ligase, partial [Spirochaetes bacterium]|nr:valine--tRNA ligase [Spirochaetota bacterium]